MSIADETLMAFADGELDADARAAVESAMREDPDVERRVARHRALRKRVQSSLAGSLQEPVPERLLGVVNRSGKAHAAQEDGDSTSGVGKASNVVDLRRARAASARAAQARAPGRGGAASRRRPAVSWRPAGAIAAGIVMGIGIGYGLWKQGGVSGALPIVPNATGALVADGRLAGALSTQLAVEQDKGSAIRIGVSYRSKSGDYCRSFTLASEQAVPNATVASGVACKHAEQWQIQALARGVAAEGGDYRTAASGVVPLILSVIQEQIRGEPLDAAGEAAARQRAWR